MLSIYRTQRFEEFAAWLRFDQAEFVKRLNAVEKLLISITSGIANGGSLTRRKIYCIFADLVMRIGILAKRAVNT
jgi:hypothetical protein